MHVYELTIEPWHNKDWNNPDQDHVDRFLMDSTSIRLHKLLWSCWHNEDARKNFTIDLIYIRDLVHKFDCCIGDYSVVHSYEEK